MILLLFLSGLVLLVGGGELLVRGAAKLAASLGVPPLIVGLTVVAFGTSAPELAVSVQASLDGNTAIALGNVVGSNIFNSLFILGVSALIVPLAVSVQLVRLDVPIMIGAAFLLLLIAQDGAVSRADGAMLAAGGIGYVLLQILLSRRFPEPIDDERAEGHRSVLRDLVMIAVGLALLVLGSRWLVSGAVALAERLGASQLVIGLTIVAAGTSLPEVVTSVVAGMRGQRDIAVGNVVGSNIFNILIVLGFAAVVSPSGLAVAAEAIRFDIPVMVAVSAMCLPIFFGGYDISRIDGGFLFSYYVVYTTYLIMTAGEHEVLPAFRIIFWVLIPASVLFLLWSALVGWWRDRRRARGRAGGRSNDGGDERRWW